MQQPALRAVWALQQMRYPALSSLEQVLTLVGVQQGRGLSSWLSPPSDRAAAIHTSRSGNVAISAHCQTPSNRMMYGSAAAPPPVSQMPAATQPSGAFSVEIAVQGFEKRYVDMACNTIDDIIMLAFAPKSYAALPTGAPAPTDAPVNLAFGAVRRDIRLPWHRTRFSIIASPHVDKTGMEQFERREYKSVLTAATNSREELQQLLEAFKIYQFTGVQIRLDVTSAQQVELPAGLRIALASARGEATASVPAAPAAPQQSQSVLGSPTASIPAPRNPVERFTEELDIVLRVLRPLIWVGHQARRRALDAVPEYGSWRQKRTQEQVPTLLPPSAVAAGAIEDEGAEATGGVEGEESYDILLRRRMNQQLALLRRLSATPTTPADAAPQGQLQEPGAGGAEGAGSRQAAAAAAYGLDPAVAAELLSRIDRELLHAHEAALAGKPAPPAATGVAASGAHGAQDSGAAAIRAAAGAASPGAFAGGPPQLDAQKMTPAEYTHAVLQYVQYVDSLCESSAAAATRRQEDRALQLAAPSLALRLLQLWWAATSIEFKQYLALPPVEVEKQILEEQLRREELAKEARGAARGTGQEATPAERQRAGLGSGGRPGGRPPLFGSRTRQE